MSNCQFAKRVRQREREKGVERGVMALNRLVYTALRRSSSFAIPVSILRTVTPQLQTVGKMSTYKKVQVVKLTSDFAAATEIKEEAIVSPGVGEVRVKNSFAGVNATDINISAGRYFTDGKVPFDVGFEGLGVIDAIGSSVTGFSVGQNVLYIGSKGFSEVIYAKSEELVPVPDQRPEYIATLVCGLTAAIGLDVVSLSSLSLFLPSSFFYSICHFMSCSFFFFSLYKAGLIKPGEKVLITAAAGGTGHIAVQWAKSKGCHVIGLTSSPEKAAFLKSIGADDIINYKTEDLDQVLTNKYPV